MINKDFNRPFELTGKHVAMIFCGFFGIIIAVNVSMAMLASSSWTGLVVSNSYVASQKFNGELLQARSQAKQGWASSISFENGQLVAHVESGEKTDIQAKTSSLDIGRPAFEQMDQRLTGTIQGNKVLFQNLSLQPGLWQAKLIVAHANGTYRRDFRLHVNQNGNARIDP